MFSVVYAVWKQFGLSVANRFIDIWYQFGLRFFTSIFSWVSVNPWDWLTWPLHVIADMILNVDTLLTDLGDLVFDAFIDAIRVTLQAAKPKSMNWQVVKHSDAFDDCVDCFLVDATNAVSGRGTYVLQFTTWLTQRLQSKPFIFNPTLERLLFKQVKTLLRTFFFRVLRIILTVIQYLAMPYIFLALLEFLKKVDDHEVLVPLQQKTKRKKVKSAEGIIRRREPGGNPP